MLLLGCAGSGKTEAIVELIRHFKSTHSRILILSYTHASLRTLLEKLNGLKVKTRTIHSLALSFCKKLRRDCVMTTRDISSFLKKYSLTLTQKYSFDFVYEMFEFEKAGVGDRLFALFTFVRHTYELNKDKPLHFYTTHEFYEHFKSIYIKTQDIFKLSFSVQQAYEIFCDYYDFMAENAKYDYERMLESAIFDCSSLNSDVVIIDESQDMSKLMCCFVIELVKLNPHVKFVIAGDLYQSIYPFSAPSFFLEELKKIDPQFGYALMLEKSKRVPERIMRAASSFIDKRYESERKGGVIKFISLESAYQILLDSLEDDIMILARASCFLNDYIAICKKIPVPFKVFGKGISYDSMSPFEAYLELKQKERVSIKSINFLLDMLTKYNIELVDPKLYAAVAYILFICLNSKGEKIDSSNEGNVMRYVEFVLKLINERLDDIFLQIFCRKFVIFKNTLRHRHRAIRLSTIHSAKGSEARTVILDLRLTRRSCFDIELERKILYVAFTRAKEKLYLVMPRASSFSYLSIFPDLLALR